MFLYRFFQTLGMGNPIANGQGELSNEMFVYDGLGQPEKVVFLTVLFPDFTACPGH